MCIIDMRVLDHGLQPGLIEYGNCRWSVCCLLDPKADTETGKRLKGMYYVAQVVGGGGKLRLRQLLSRWSS